MLSLLGKVAASPRWLLWPPKPLPALAEGLDVKEELFDRISPIYFVVSGYPHKDLLFLHAMKTRHAAHMARAQVLLALGMVRRGGKPPHRLVLGLCRRALLLFEEIRDPLARARVLRQCALVLCQGYEVRLELIDEALTLSAQVDDNYGQIEAHMMSGCRYFCQERWRETRRVGLETARLAVTGQEPFYEICRLYWAAYAHARLGELSDLDDRAGAIQACIAAALRRLWEGDLTGALGQLEQALPDSPGFHGRCLVEESLAIILVRAQEWKRLKILLERWRQAMPSVPLLRVQWNIHQGQRLAQQGKRPEALASFGRAIEDCVALDLPGRKARALACRSQLSGDTQELALAKQLLEQEGDRLILHLLATPS